MTKMDPKLEMILRTAEREFGLILDGAIDQAEVDGLSACTVYEGLSHLLAQRVGQIEMIHLESDVKGDNVEKVIDKDLLTRAIGMIQINCIASLTQGMNQVLVSGGHYTIDQLKADIIGAAKKSDDDNGGKTFH